MDELFLNPDNPCLHRHRLWLSISLGLFAQGKEQQGDESCWSLAWTIKLVAWKCGDDNKIIGCSSSGAGVAEDSKKDWEAATSL